jgi:hypothetical protein
MAACLDNDSAIDSQMLVPLEQQLLGSIYRYIAARCSIREDIAWAKDMAMGINGTFR